MCPAVIFVLFAAHAQYDDWPMLGGDPSRNAVSQSKRTPTDWNVKSGKNVKWSVPLGSMSYGGPVVAGGRVYVGTNSGGPGDEGILSCLRASDGALLWRAIHDKLPEGREQDWPEVGVASTPCVDGSRVYYLSNRAELMCLDSEGFANGNQGDQNEERRGPKDADVLWRLDLRKELGVVPRYSSASSPVVLGDHVFVVTGNGLRGRLPPANAPSFVAVNKMTGRVVWSDASPTQGVLDGQWGSPTIVEIDGKAQVVFPGGDGWLYAFEPHNGKLLWKFDCNPKGAVNLFGARGTRDYLLAPAVASGNLIYIGTGRDPEHGEGTGHLWCIDASKANATNIDLSPVGDNFDPKAPANRRSGLVWHFGDAEAQARRRIPSNTFHRTLSSCVVAGELCFTADFSGYVYCLDAKTGEVYWQHDALCAIWASPLLLNGNIYISTEEGDVLVIEASKSFRLLARIEMGGAIYNPVIAAGDTLYVKTRSNLYAIASTASRSK